MNKQENCLEEKRKTKNSRKASNNSEFEETLSKNKKQRIGSRRESSKSNNDSQN
jgi:hypothetical protein